MHLRLQIGYFWPGAQFVRFNLFFGKDQVVQIFSDILSAFVCTLSLIKMQRSDAMQCMPLIHLLTLVNPPIESSQQQDYAWLEERRYML